MSRFLVLWPATAVLLGALSIAALSLADDGEAAPASRPAETARPTEAPDRSTEGQRVIIRVDRLTSVRGHIALEDETIIVIRTLEGELAHFSKVRVMQIQRLLEPAPDRKAYLYLVAGEVVEGSLIADGFDEVIFEVHGIRSRFRRTSVDRIELEPTFEERYENFLASINDDTPERHFLLCAWLANERRYELAHFELTRLLEKNDLHAAREMRRTVEAQMALIANRGDGTAKKSDEDDRPNTSRGNAELPRLNDEQINLIKVFEMDFRRPPKVGLSPDTIRAFMNHYVEDPRIPASPEGRAALEEASAIDIVRLMFELKARDFYPQIQVLSEPYAMTLFRRNVHNTWLMNSCATSECHGGPDSGRFRLIQHRHHIEKIRYTNFLILERLELDPGWPLINYEQPLDSIIIQYGLPSNHARRAHPAVPGWRPAFRRASDRTVLDTVKWIEAMMQPRVDYPFEFTLPGADAETSPLGELRPGIGSEIEPGAPDEGGEPAPVGSPNGT